MGKTYLRMMGGLDMLYNSVPITQDDSPVRPAGTKTTLI